MMQIQITQGNKAIIDDEDFDLVSKYKWYTVIPVTSNSIKYAAAKNYQDGGRRTILMHRIIIGALKGFSVDHIDGDGLNNQKNNLRICTVAENNWNSGLCKTNKSGFMGVCWHKNTKKFRAYISSNNKTIHIGLFDDPIEAAKARNAVAERLRGEFASLNQV